MLYIINSSVIYIYIYSSLSMATVIVLGCRFRLSNFEPLLYYAHTHTQTYVHIPHTETYKHKHTCTSAFSLQVFLLKVSSVFSSKVQVCANTLHVCAPAFVYSVCRCMCLQVPIEVRGQP